MPQPFVRSFCTLALLLTSCAQAQPAAGGGKPPDLVNPTGGPAQPPKVSRDASVDQVLDALDARGKGLKGFSAKVSLNEEDDIGLSSTRTGRVWYQQAAGDNARIRVSFDKRENEKQVFEEKIDYVLEGAWLIDRDYKRKKEIKRQVLRPGEKINLLKLGEGPFPLPIGQDKAEVHKLFTVTKEPLAEDKELADTTHLKLVPKAGTEFAKKFSEIDVWIDPKTQFPKRIDTADAAKAKFRTTRLDDVLVNPAELGDKDFTLPPVEDKEWERTVEPYSDSSSGRE
jgi:outer membrane lipoprotein-sorting protein